MKQFLPAAMAFLLAVNGAHASAELVKQKAQHIRDVNNQQQGVVTQPPNAPASGTAGAASPSAPQGMSAAQQALVDRLETDLVAVKPGTNVTDQQRTGLEMDMAALAKGANQPTKAELAKLSTDLSAALAGKTVAERDMGQLAKAINIVVNCTALTPARAQAYVTAAQTILKSSAVSDENIQTVSTDMKAIIYEIQKSKPKLFQ
jgi:hypothetical protein